MTTSPHVNSRHRAHLERYFELVDAHAWDQMFELFHPNITYKRGGTPLIRGIDEFRDFYLRSRQIESGHHEIDMIMAEDDWAVAKGRFVGTLRTGRAVATEFADFHLFRDGLIWQRLTYFLEDPI